MHHVGSNVMVLLKLHYFFGCGDGGGFSGDAGPLSEMAPDGNASSLLTDLAWTGEVWYRKTVNKAV